MDEQADGPRAQLTLTDGAPGAGAGGRLVVRLAGELDMAAVEDIAGPVGVLLARRPQPLVLELGELEFMDSSGVALLIRIANHFGSVEARHATTPVRRVIEVLGLAERLGLDER